MKGPHSKLSLVLPDIGSVWHTIRNASFVFASLGSGSEHYPFGILSDDSNGSFFEPLAAQEINFRFPEV